MKDIEQCARSLLELLEAMGEVGVVIWTDGKSTPVMCQREADLRPMLERVLQGMVPEGQTLH